MRTVQVKAPRGPLKLDAYDNPIQNVYISRIQKIKHPVLGEVLANVPIKTYENVSQFWTWKPEEFLKHGPVQALAGHERATDHARPLKTGRAVRLAPSTRRSR